jgi:hypothetical protein
MNDSQAYRVIGRAEPRSDGGEKVTGKAVYTVDVDLPGMAHAKVLRSPYPHARIVRVDSSKAERFPGVYAVITKEDQRELGMFGAAYKDQTIVAVDKVRYVGDPVAAVAAVDEATAEEALALIDVEYQELPAVSSLEEALAPGAVLVHDSASMGGELMGQRYETPKEFAGSNLCYRFSYAKGEVAEGLRNPITYLKTRLPFPASSISRWNLMPPWLTLRLIGSPCGREHRSRLHCASTWPIYSKCRSIRFVSSSPMWGADMVENWR